MVRPVSVTLVPVVVAASVPPLVYTSYEATGYVPGVEAVQLSVAVPDVLLDVLEDKPETVGVPGAPGDVTPVPPLPGMCTTVSE